MCGSKVDLFAQRGLLVPRDVAPFQTFSGRGMTFQLQSYDWNGCACLSHLSMRAFFGLMKMDTIICTPYAKDMPLFSYDYISVLGRHTLLLETYNTLVHPVDLAPMMVVKERYHHLNDKPAKPAWYDSLKLPPTVCKIADSTSLDNLSDEMIRAYLDIFESSLDVDVQAKVRRNRDYVEGLIQDGPTFKVVSKMLGVDPAKTLFRRFLFGTEHQ